LAAAKETKKIVLEVQEGFLSERKTMEESAAAALAKPRGQRENKFRTGTEIQSRGRPKEGGVAQLILPWEKDGANQGSSTPKKGLRCEP